MLSKIPEYFILALPHESFGVSDYNALRSDLASLEPEYLGKCVVIPYVEKVPLWYYFLIFSVLYPSCPAIAIEMSSGTRVLLRNLYPETEYAQPEQMLFLPSAVAQPDRFPKEITPEVTYDLNTLPAESLGAMKNMVERIKERLVFSDAAVFIGTAEVVPAMILLACVYGYTRKVKYHIDGHIIEI